MQPNSLHLSFKLGYNQNFYFVLNKNLNNDEYFIDVRWISYDKHQMFEYKKSTLKFFVNNDYIFTLKPYSIPKVISYNIENNSSEEECIFQVSIDQLQKLAYAKKVDVELFGRNKLVFGYFNKWHTFRAFKNFLKFS